AAPGVDDVGPGLLIRASPIAILKGAPDQHVAGGAAGEDRGSLRGETEAAPGRPASHRPRVLVLDGEAPHLGARDPRPVLAGERGAVDGDLVDLVKGVLMIESPVERPQGEA